MDKRARQGLKEIIDQFGQSICDDPRRCESLMRDYFGSNRKEINLLVGALREGVVKDIVFPPAGITPSMLGPQLIKKLEDNLGLSSENASWAVESWAMALGKTTIVAGKSPPPITKRGPEKVTIVAPEPHPPTTARGPSKFWMVKVEGSRSTSRPHREKAKAKRETVRLSRIPTNISKQVILLEAVEACRASSSGVMWQSIGKQTVPSRQSTSLTTSRPLKFWMVKVEGSRSTSHKHREKAKAKVEAERLSRLRDVTGKRQVILLEAVAACRASGSGVMWQTL